MRSLTTERFRRAYTYLPIHIRDAARKAYKRWKENPKHPSLQYKQVHNSQPIFSVRINLSYRALGVKEGNTIIWFWIGSHAEYDRLIASL